MFSDITYVMICYITYAVMLYNMCYVMYICYVMLYNLCYMTHVMLYNLCYVI